MNGKYRGANVNNRHIGMASFIIITIIIIIIITIIIIFT